MSEELDAVFRKVEFLTSLGATIGALEQLSDPGILADDHLLGRHVTRLRGPKLWRAHDSLAEKALGYPQILSVFGARALAGASLLLPGISRTHRGVLSGFLCASSYATQTRMVYGFDGSDHFAFLNYACASLEKLYAHDPRAREEIAAFLALQSCFSYLVAGVSKLMSPAWRDGSAIPGIFRTSTYGDAGFHDAVRDRPWLARTVAWGTIAGELAFPLALVAPAPVARGLMAAGAGFHLGNARFMGLNRFLWSYCATYPAVEHAGRTLRAARAARRASGTSLLGTWTRAVAGAAQQPPAARPLPQAAARPARPGVARSAAAAGAGLLALAGAGAVHRRNRRRQAVRASAPGRFVRVASRPVHVLDRTRGEGPTVVFENGMACPSTEWGWVLRQLPEHVPYVAYDRPGTGWSPAAGGPRDAAQSAADLRELLHAVGARPPFLLAGHSVGGLLIRSFALRHPDETHGLVFVDSSHPDQLERSPRQRRTTPVVRQRMTTTWLRTALTPARGRQSGDTPFDTLPEHLVGPTRACLEDPGMWLAARREISRWLRSWAADAGRLHEAGTRPVAVLTAGRTSRTDPVHLELQRDLAGLSPVSRHRLVEEATHESLVMSAAHAGEVVGALAWAREKEGAYVRD
ncbi:alpha/beta fold hydrolase [Streptomyces sp. JJ36]|uniref:alpha/beta fold hydrolase n=1 Tax=Streptomyces sp. JJ36 TaxID=2736645 RepID=UPI001F178729|nr:alpha/beta fold hydrolase [Streptomyces sp. JJ36]MCF6522824.1 alpha/beta fold hydrolase [Streptomyces sp. JJ36]